MNSPVKVLFIVMDFYQAGAQRFVYEVHSALNRKKFDVHILSFRDLNASKQYSDFYYSKHEKIGTKIYFVNQLIGGPTIFNRALSALFRSTIVQKVLSGKRKKRVAFLLNNFRKKRRILSAFINHYDVVGWMGEYTFSFLCSYLADSIYNRSIIFLMNAKFQGFEVYHNYPKEKHYIFVSGYDDEDQLKHELSEFSDYRHVLFPLYLEINTKIKKWVFNNDKKKIGIFTRLDHMKPLDPFLYAFHMLLDKMPNLELHIFGSGDPLLSGVKKYTQHLGIEKSIFFRGHVPDIAKSAIDEQLNLVWYQGYKNRPAGYAGFDICLTGIPQLFWEFTYSFNEIRSSETYPVFKNLNQFVEKSFEILTNEKSANTLSERQFSDVVENRDMVKHVHILENLFDEMALNNP
jgi:glycosyltransferase involved in cell wall biosynthesis